jgi:hypothetical protein
MQIQIGPYTEELIKDLFDPSDGMEFTDECFSDPEQVEAIFTELLVNGPNLNPEYRQLCFEVLDLAHVDLVERAAEIYYEERV